MNRLLKRVVFNPHVLRLSNSAFRPLLRKARTRNYLNRQYSRLSSTGKVIFASFAGRAFWDGARNLEQGDWAVEFLGKRTMVPVRAESAKLDWIYAMSMLGHDPEVVETYERIVHANGVPATFIDIGANFGMHSMMFAKLGARVISFEPNPECGTYASDIFHHNDVSVEWHGIALGSSSGSIDLHFPEGETWLGTTVSEVVDQLSTVRSLRSITVPMRPLDDILDQAAVSGPVLIKIDVEGAEVPVLRSGTRFIAAARPTILFEANDESCKRQMVPFLEEIGYVAFALPYTPGAGDIPLTGQEIVLHAGTNFAALPRDSRL